MAQFKILGRTDGIAGWYVVASFPTIEHAQTQLAIMRDTAPEGVYYVLALASQMKYLPVRTAA